MRIRLPLAALAAATAHIGPRSILGDFLLRGLAAASRTDMRLLFMAPLWIAGKICLLALKIVSAVCLLLDLVPTAEALRHRSRKAG